VRVLLAQELGLGRWHLEALAALGRALEREGAQPIFAVPDVGAAVEVGTLPAARVLAAPHHMPAATRRRAGPARSFADILADAGWDDATLLAGLGASWRHVLELARPDHVIADFAPTLVAAAAGRVPLTAIGLGFSLPPSTLTFYPPFIETELEPLLDDEARLLEHARVAFGAPASDAARLPAVLAAPTRVTALALLDPYERWRARPPVGPLERLGAPRPTPPSTAGVEAFVYLSGEDTRTAPLVAALTRAGVHVRGHVRDVSRAWLDALGPAGAGLSRVPLRLPEALADVHLVVHHGGAGLVHQASAIGRVQLVVPRYLEQHMNARALAARGVAHALRDVPGEAELAALLAALTDGATREAAARLAHELAATRDEDAAATLAREVVSSRPSSG